MWFELSHSINVLEINVRDPMRYKILTTIPKESRINLENDIVAINRTYGGNSIDTFKIYA